MGIDVFAREVAAQAIPSKDPETVNKALEKTQETLVGDERNFSVTTDLGNEFNKIEDVLPPRRPGDKKPRKTKMRQRSSIEI